MSWAVLAFTAVAQEPSAWKELEFEVLPSVQYAHEDIFRRTPSGLGPVFTATREIAQGQRLDILVLPRDCAIDDEEMVDVTYDLLIRRPDGSQMEPKVGLEVALRRKAFPGMILFPGQLVRFSTGPDDPPGEYLFEVTVHDKVGGRSATKNVAVMVGGSNEPLPLPEGFDPARWIAHYYLNPTPRFAIPAFAAMSRIPQIANRAVDGHGALLGFYEQILADNPWLLTQLKAHLPTVTHEAERRLVNTVLAYVLRDDREFRNPLPRAVRRQMPVPSAEPMSGGQLDLQWGRFLAGGRFEPIRALVAVAEAYLPHRGELERFKQLETKPKVTPPEVLKAAILNSALWSLGSNAHQHKRVRDYLTGIMEAVDISEAMEQVLRDVLAWKPAVPNA